MENTKDGMGAGRATEGFNTLEGYTCREAQKMVCARLRANTLCAVLFLGNEGEGGHYLDGSWGFQGKGHARLNYSLN